MSEINLEILRFLAKRASFVGKVLLFISFLFFSFLVYIIIYEKLYDIAKYINTPSSIIDLAYFLFISSSVFFVFGLIIFVVKGGTEHNINKLKINFYKKTISKVRNVFIARFNDTFLKEKQFQDLIQYSKVFEKNNTIHNIDENNLHSLVISEIDTLLFIYKINDKDNILWSIWYSGDFVAVAIAINIKYKKEVEQSKIENYFRDKLNLENANITFQIRDKFYWYDIKYKVEDDFLFDSFLQEKIIRKIAHIVTVGLIPSMEFIGWKCKK